MAFSLKQIEARIGEFIALCKKSGIKVTTQRIEIFREILNCEDHPDAEKLCTRIRHKLPAVSLDTVYRNLWLLKSLGLIDVLGVSREKTRFEANHLPHHHFVCEECGLIVDFFSEQLRQISLPKSVEGLGSISRTQVEVRGICKKCLKARKNMNGS